MRRACLGPHSYNDGGEEVGGAVGKEGLLDALWRPLGNLSLHDHVEVFLGSFWDHFGIIAGSFWHGFGMILKSF